MIDFSTNKLVLAPMAGVNDPVFRAICKRMGAAFTYTEMISSKGLSYKNHKTKTMIEALPEDRPYAVQLFGSEPDTMATEAQVLEQSLGEDLVLIDLNMGCPARKVASGGNGAALLQQPELAMSIIEAVSTAVKVPVTVKMRLVNETDTRTAHSEDDTHTTHPEDDIHTTHPEDDTLVENLEDNATLQFALNAEKAGAAALTLHGRTAAQMYKGEANREVLSLLARMLKIPLIASGDVFSTADIDDYLARGASAVMAARGARGNPWIFSHTKPSYQEVISVAREHTTRLYEWDAHKLVWMRKHLAWYFKGMPHAVGVRKAVQTAVALEDYLRILDECEAHV